MSCETEPPTGFNISVVEGVQMKTKDHPGNQHVTEDGNTENTGRWTSREHDLFLQGLRDYGKAWKKIANLIQTRTVVQIRTHAQKYFQKIQKAQANGELSTGLDVQEELSKIGTGTGSTPRSRAGSTTGSSGGSRGTKRKGNRNLGVAASADCINVNTNMNNMSSVAASCDQLKPVNVQNFSRSNVFAQNASQSWQSILEKSSFDMNPSDTVDSDMGQMFHNGGMRRGPQQQGFPTPFIDTAAGGADEGDRRKRRCTPTASGGHGNGSIDEGQTYNGRGNNSYDGNFNKESDQSRQLEFLISQHPQLAAALGSYQKNAALQHHQQQQQMDQNKAGGPFPGLSKKQLKALAQNLMKDMALKAAVAKAGGNRGAGGDASGNGSGMMGGMNASAFLSSLTKAGISMDQQGNSGNFHNTNPIGPSPTSTATALYNDGSNGNGNGSGNGNVQNSYEGQMKHLLQQQQQQQQQRQSSMLGNRGYAGPSASTDSLSLHNHNHNHGHGHGHGHGPGQNHHQNHIGGMSSDQIQESYRAMQQHQQVQNFLSSIINGGGNGSYGGSSSDQIGSASMASVGDNSNNSNNSNNNNNNNRFQSNAGANAVAGGFKDGGAVVADPLDMNDQVQVVDFDTMVDDPLALGGGGGGGGGGGPQGDHPNRVSQSTGLIEQHLLPGRARHGNGLFHPGAGSARSAGAFMGLGGNGGNGGNGRVGGGGGGGRFGGSNLNSSTYDGDYRVNHACVSHDSLAGFHASLGAGAGAGGPMAQTVDFVRNSLRESQNGGGVVMGDLGHLRALMERGQLQQQHQQQQGNINNNISNNSNRPWNGAQGGNANAMNPPMAVRKPTQQQQLQQQLQQQQQQQQQQGGGSKSCKPISLSLSLSDTKVPKSQLARGSQKKEGGGGGAAGGGGGQSISNLASSPSMVSLSSSGGNNTSPTSNNGSGRGSSVIHYDSVAASAATASAKGDGPGEGGGDGNGANGSEHRDGTKAGQPHSIGGDLDIGNIPWTPDGGMGLHFGFEHMGDQDQQGHRQQQQQQGQQQHHHCQDRSQSKSRDGHSDDLVEFDSLLKSHGGSGGGAGNGHGSGDGSGHGSGDGDHSLPSVHAAVISRFNSSGHHQRQPGQGQGQRPSSSGGGSGKNPTGSSNPGHLFTDFGPAESDVDLMYTFDDEDHDYFDASHSQNPRHSLTNGPLSASTSSGSSSSSSSSNGNGGHSHSDGNGHGQQGTRKGQLHNSLYSGDIGTTPSANGNGGTGGRGGGQTHAGGRPNGGANGGIACRLGSERLSLTSSLGSRLGRVGGPIPPHPQPHTTTNANTTSSSSHGNPDLQMVERLNTLDFDIGIDSSVGGCLDNARISGVSLGDDIFDGCPDGDFSVGL